MCAQKWPSFEKGEGQGAETLFDRRRRPLDRKHGRGIIIKSINAASHHVVTHKEKGYAH
jgi:hypothetical protein